MAKWGCGFGRKFCSFLMSYKMIVLYKHVIWWRNVYSRTNAMQLELNKVLLVKVERKWPLQETSWTYFKANLINQTRFQHNYFSAGIGEWVLLKLLFLSNNETSILIYIITLDKSHDGLSTKYFMLMWVTQQPSNS